MAAQFVHTDGESYTSATGKAWLKRSIGPSSLPLLDRCSRVFLRQRLSTPLRNDHRHGGGNPDCGRVRSTMHGIFWQFGSSNWPWPSQVIRPSRYNFKNCPSRRFVLSMTLRLSWLKNPRKSLRKSRQGDFHNRRLPMPLELP